MEFDDSPCRFCGAPLEWVECDACGGEGEYDAYETDPLWYDPDDTAPCPQCEGDGGWWWCYRCAKVSIPVLEAAHDIP